MTSPMPVTTHPSTRRRDRSTSGARSEALAAYPHIAGCCVCQDYAAAAQDRFSAATVLSATLAHHDAGHRGDTLSTASQHFAIDD